jgi:DAACS family dicarboxylate/amino acid:cation (Na+ or H+) symporter
MVVIPLVFASLSLGVAGIGIFFALMVGVAGLIFSVTARFGFDLLKALAWYVATVLIGLFLHQLGTFSILVRLFAKINPLAFFKKIETIMRTAFSTSSSNATLPTTIMISQQNLGIPAKITGFVLPPGATMNMNGTALFEGVTVLFLAQVFGVQLDLRRSSSLWS